MLQEEIQEKLLARKPLEPRKIIKEPITDFTCLVAAPTWNLEDGLNVLATFKHSENCNNISNKTYLDTWHNCHTILYYALKEYELANKTFTIHCEKIDESSGDGFGIILHESIVHPDKFVHWAREMSLPVPDEFYEKVMRASAVRPIANANDELLSLLAKQKREIGRLHREQENFDLAIKATVKAVRYCIAEGRRVKRKELFDLLTVGQEAVSKELFEKILPLLPQEFRRGAGNPGNLKGENTEA